MNKSLVENNTSKCPLRRTEGIEKMHIVTRINVRATPVGLAIPEISPKQLGLEVNVHSK